MLRMGVVVVLLAGAVACVRDDKGKTCGIQDVYSNEDGDQYCEDKDAPDDCRELIDEIVDAYEICNGPLFDDVEARRRAEEVVDCDDAVATTKDYDECIDKLHTPECEVDGDVDLPPECRGAVLVSN